MTEIPPFSITHLMADQLYNFHALTAKQITKATPAALHVETFFDEYKQLLDTLRRISEATAFLPLTAVLEEYDRRRDYLLRRVFKTANEMLRNPRKDDPAMESNAARIINSYAGIENQEMNKQTRKIEAFLAVIEKNDLEVLINSYGGLDLVGELRGANGMFNANMEQRIREMEELEKFDRTTVRQRINELYRLMRKQINAYALVAPTPKITEFITTHNALIDEHIHMMTYLQYGGSENEKNPPRPREEDEEDDLLMC